MNRFRKSGRFTALRNVLSPGILLFVAVFIIFMIGISRVSQSSVLDERRLLEEALTRDIAHCYAVEGSYPESLTYLCDHYGLTYDTEKFLVNYEYIGANILPTFSIFER